MMLHYGNFVIDQLEYFYALIPLVILLLYLLRKRYVKEDQRLFKSKGKKTIIFFLRLLFFAMLILVIANPHYEFAENYANITKVKVIIDESYSTKLYDLDEIEATLNAINKKGISLDLEKADLQDYSSIGNVILNNLAPEENILLVSDGQNNFGSSLEDVALFASSINSKIFSIKLNVDNDDAGIYVEGPSKVVSGVENTYTIVVNEVGSVGKKVVRLYVDDKVVYDGRYFKEIEIKRFFQTGTHIIKAELEVGEKDYFKENNVYYKTITVYPKPKILFVSEVSSPLHQLYFPLYDVDLVDNLDTGLDKYYAVILNNIDANQLSDDDVDKLEEYVSDGNGLLVIGGKNSYDYGNYNKSLLINMLPVLIGKAKKKQDVTNNFILMDTGASSSDILTKDITYFDVQKSAVADMIKSMNDNHKVGVIEANYYLNTVSELSEVGPKRQTLINAISLLKPQGFSELRYAYQKAYDTLRLVRGSKSIFIVTDGKLIPADQAVTLQYVDRARKNSVKTFIVTVGQQADEDFLKAVKEKGGGEILKIDEKNKIKLYLGNPDDIPPDDLVVFVYDSNHFITKGLSELGHIYGYNQVYPKSTSRLLLTTSSGDPVLTVWNYGLGRVATLSSDDGSLWLPDLLKKENSQVLIRTLNWLIEDPERKNNLIIDIPELRLGENSIITVKYDKYPTSNKINFYEIDNNLYQGNYFPNQTGLGDILGLPVAVNYKKEYLNLGINKDFKNILKISGGKIIDNDADTIIQTLKSSANVESLRTVDLRWIFIIAAIIIYLTEILIRRIYELNLHQ